MKKCLVEGCNSDVNYNGYCSVHARQLRAYNTTFSESKKEHKKMCAVVGCENKYHAKGFCKKHYKQLVKLKKDFVYDYRCCIIGCNNHYHKNGFCLDHYKQYYPHEFMELSEQEKCSVTGCDYKIYSKGLCKKHYNLNWKYGEIKEPIVYPEKCSVEGCDEAHEAKGYCAWHYGHFIRYGYPLTNSKKRHEKNEIVDNGNGTSYVYLYDNKGIYKDKTLVDTEDVEKILKYKWCMNPSGYVMGPLKFHKPLSRYLLDCIDDKEIFVDHINRNTMDNRKENLRKCTPQENTFNRDKQSNNSSGYKGVYCSRTKKTWVYSIQKSGVSKRKGGFATPEDAAKAYDKEAVKLFGEFAVTNF